jgi:hypothetical protein
MTFYVFNDDDGEAAFVMHIFEMEIDKSNRSSSYSKNILLILFQDFTVKSKFLHILNFLKIKI